MGAFFQPRRIHAPMNAHNAPERKSPRGRYIAAAVFACAGLIALGFSIRSGRQRYLREHPPPLPNVIAPIPDDKVEAVRGGMKLLAKTVLHATPEQEEKLNEIWKNPPRSVEEVIQYQKRTDEVLTPEQRATFKPIRNGFRNRVIDQILSPASKRMTPEDFAKFTQEIKARVAHRIDGP